VMSGVGNAGASDRIIDRQGVMPSLDGVKERNPLIIDPEESKPKPPAVRRNQLMLPDDHRKIWFAPRESFLTREAARSLDVIADAFRTHPKASGWICGSANGEEQLQEFEQSKLARDRAQIAVDYLVARGVKAEQLRIAVITPKMASLCAAGMPVRRDPPDAYVAAFSAYWYE